MVGFPSGLSVTAFHGNDVSSPDRFIVSGSDDPYESVTLDRAEMDDLVAYWTAVRAEEAATAYQGA